MKVFVVIKMWDGIIDGVEIFRGEKEAEEALNEWERKEGDHTEGSGIWVVALEI